MKAIAKAVLRGLALIAVSPALVSFWVKRLVIGGDRALVGSTQTLSLIPGLTGQYLRRAFLSQTIAFCAPTAVIEFGVLLSQTGARIDDSAYIGPRCHLGLVHVGANVMLAAGVHVPSGARLHGMELGVSMREQTTTPVAVVIGAGAWIGSNAVVMAGVGADAIVGAGAVVTREIPAGVIAGGVPARVIKQRGGNTAFA